MRMHSASKILSFLNRVQREADGISNKDELIRTYKKWFRTVLPYKNIAMVFLNGKAGFPYIADVSSESYKELISRHVEDGILQWAAEHEVPFLFDESNADHLNGAAQIIFLPVRNGRHPAGVVEIVPARKIRELGEDQKALLQLLSAQLTKHLKNLVPSNEEKDIPSHRKNNSPFVAKAALMGNIVPQLIHEISNPLTTVQGRVNLLMLASNDPVVANSNLQVIHNQIERLTHFLHSLTYLLSIDVYNSNDRRESVSQILADLNSIFMWFASKANARVEVKGVNKNSKIFCDADLVKLLLLNGYLLLYDLIQSKDKMEIALYTHNGKKYLTMAIRESEKRDDTKADTNRLDDLKRKIRALQDLLSGLAIGISLIDEKNLGLMIEFSGIKEQV